MMINLHIGIPSLLPNLINEIRKSGIVSDEDMAAIVSRDQWKTYFRPSFSGKRRKILEVASTPSVNDFLHNISANKNVAISQHTFVAKAMDLFSSDYQIRDQVPKIQSLVSLFGERPVTVHVLIKDQYEYLRSLDDVSLECVLLSEKISVPYWSVLVNEIRLAVPNAKLIVWDCEEEAKIAYAFATWMLDFSNDLVMDKMYDFVCRYMEKNVVLSNERELDIPPSVADSLDLRYSLDCEAISRMDGVTFIEKGKVPKSFHVPL